MSQDSDTRRLESKISLHIFMEKSGTEIMIIPVMCVLLANIFFSLGQYVSKVTCPLGH